MKHTKHFLLMATMLLCSLVTSAYDFEANGVYYNILSEEEATCEVTSDEGSVTYSGDIEIPEVVSDRWWSSNKYTVVAIGNNAFSDCQQISVSLPRTIKRIGDRAFANCQFENISLPDTILQIGNEAFSSCQGISALSLPQGVEFIGDNAFSYSDFGGNLTIPLSCKYVGISAFWETDIVSLEFERMIIVPDTYCTIGKSAFGNCDLLVHVNLNALGYHIGDNPFIRCDNLKGIEGVGVYTDYAHTQGHLLIDGCLYRFTEENGTRYLNLLSCPAGKDCYVSPNTNTEDGKKHTLVSLEENAFAGCKKITFLDIPNTVKKIGDYCLFMTTDGADSIYRKVIIPESVEEIGKYAIGWSGYNWDIYLHSKKIKHFNPSMFNKKYGYLHIPFGTKSAFIENNPYAENNFYIIDDIGAVNSHTVTYMLDGEIYEIVVTEHGTVIETIPEPTKEGYTFSGWGEIPETMPAENIIISGVFIINKYLVTFKIGDEVLAADSLEYGAAIVAPEAPEKEGYTFNGWGEVAETVPASDVTYKGTYTANTYKVYYYVGDELVHTAEVVYGEAIPEYIYEPIGEDYTFLGWIGETYETMPAHDVTYTANIESGIGQLAIDKSQLIIYDLQGRRISNEANLKEGIYIVNGRKVAIK